VQPARGWRVNLADVRHCLIFREFTTTIAGLAGVDCLVGMNADKQHTPVPRSVQPS
jgi:hypothetical protein